MKHIFYLCLFYCILFLQNSNYAQYVPSDVKKCVSFIFVNYPNAGFIPYGTAFFVGVEEKSDSITFGYLVTSKHVLRDENKKYFNDIFLRINKKEGTSDTINIPLFDKDNPTFIVHSDSTVDIAVIPMFPDRNIYDFLYIPSDLITTEDIYKNKEIHEGDEVFFTGLFANHIGTNINRPIVRFGKIALITDERVLFDSTYMDLYLIETTSFGGNSGSPLFFSLGPTRKPGVLSTGWEILLGGIVQGYFGAPTLPGFVKNPKKNIWPFENSGIAAVVPAKKLYEIIFSDQLIKMRDLDISNYRKQKDR